MSPTRQSPAEQPEIVERARADHLNEVALVGELVAIPQGRTLPDGEEVVSFRLSVRTPSTASVPGLAADGGRQRNDSVDCVARQRSVRIRLLRCGAGDIICVKGSLRHRYWRGALGINSRYEVEAETTVLIRRARKSRP